ncbi:MAG: helix-turn-helix transcriptional regulator [Rhodobacteraceae bacterium]|nr:helix-turn-helix transcriptional regulator [Paracoccaceae bacterium]
MYKNLHDMSVLNIVGFDGTFAFGESTYGDGEVFGPMSGCQLEAIYLRTGQVEIRSDGRIFNLSAPGMALVASHDRLEYRYGPTDMSNVLWCQYMSGQLDAAKITALAPHCGVMSLSAAATSLMKIGADLPSDIYSEMQNFSSALGIAVLEELLGRKKMQKTVAEIPIQVHRVRRYIEEHLESAIKMSVLAEVSGLSPQHLNRLYKSTFDENPLDYLWRLRVRRGAYMLRHTGMRISQIAYRTGFKTPNHFARLIKKKYNLSPRELRAQKWRGEVGASTVQTE